MSSTVIPLWRAVEDGIPLVEWALSFFGGSNAEMYKHVKQPHITNVKGAEQTVAVLQSSLFNAQMGATQCSHARHITSVHTQDREDEMWLPPHEERDRSHSE
ncbi:hypothetical protein ATANTOWER_000574 [Ataeniobius toweri]|uniref:Uncharacterized protein n=1 Tax=Ataeniobius toweri TaxID=208326 RepID=A0ABU7BCX1_9TELE|nr:hypothetical protein [Ataeniobius toweri]